MRLKQGLIYAIGRGCMTSHSTSLLSIGTFRPRAHQGNWQPQRNRNFRELLSAWVEHMLLSGAAPYIGRKRRLLRSRVLDIRSVILTIPDHYLVVTRDRERLTVGKQKTREFRVGRFSLKKLNEVEDKSRGHTKETGKCNATSISENYFQPFPQFALLHSVACVQLRLITVLRNCGCVAVASVLSSSWPKMHSHLWET
jgi:hypothetical protein